FEGDRLLREARGVGRQALEVVDARDLRQGRGGEGADRGDQEARAVAAAILQGEVPVARLFFPVRGGHAGREGDVAAQVELVGDDVQVFERLGLRREMLGPVPLVEQLLAERVAVGIALRIEPRAGIAVPVPGPADAGARFEHMDLHSELAQAMELVEPRDAGSDDDRVELHVFLPSSRVARVSPRWSEAQSRDLVSARERLVVREGPSAPPRRGDYPALIGLRSGRRVYQLPPPKGEGWGGAIAAGRTGEAVTSETA